MGGGVGIWGVGIPGARYTKGVGILEGEVYPQGRYLGGRYTKGEVGRYTKGVGITREG